MLLSCLGLRAQPQVNLDGLTSRYAELLEVQPTCTVSDVTVLDTRCPTKWAVIQLHRPTRKCARQTEVREQAGLEAGHCRNAIARQREHQQSNAVKNGRTRIRLVEPERGLAVCARRHELLPRLQGGT